MNRPPLWDADGYGTDDADEWLAEHDELAPLDSDDVDPDERYRDGLDQIEADRLADYRS